MPLQTSSATLTSSIESQGGAGGLLSSFGVDSSFLDSATSEASKRAGSSGSSDMFSNIVSAIGGKEDKLAKEDLDEEDAVKQHKKEYKGEKGNDPADEKSLGTAAAVQALKLWNQGEAGDKQDKGSFLGLAMSEASKVSFNCPPQGCFQHTMLMIMM